MKIYRDSLLGFLKLNEGKPKNQNHVVIFSRGEHRIDMNQDSYFEEALKCASTEINHKILHYLKANNSRSW